jgi:2-polyprenyl-6-methoxyphenol hydroxylase-like FAD-dependent oxidoreductase
MKNNNKTKEIKVSNDTINISIIGGGLGGLSLAISLIQKGFTNVKVYERDVYFNDRRQGYGLTLTNNNKGPLALLGILDECIKKNCESDCHWIFKSNGEIMGYYGRHFIKNKDNNNDNIRGNLRISRQNLRQMLLNKLPKDTVIWGKKLIDYSEYNNNIEMIIEDNNLNKEIINTNILIGADGIRSVVRRLRDVKICEEDTLLCSPLKYIGISVTIGLTPAKHPLINQRGFYILDGKQRLFTMPFREESIDSNNNIIPQLTMWQLSYSGLTEREAELLRTKSSPELISDALIRTSGWIKPVYNMINETPLSDIWSTGLYDRNPMHVYSKQRQGKGSSAIPRTNSLVTFIGDACHPMSMFKGKGVIKLTI